MGSVARLGFSLAGAFVGNMLLPGIGGSLGYAAGSMIGGAFFPEQLPDVQQQGPRLEDLSVQSSAYGGAIEHLFGTVRKSGNIIWAEPLTEIETVTEEEQGGKGGPSQTVETRTWAYYATFAIAVGKGEIAGIKRIWINGELIYNQGTTASAADVVLSNELWSGKFRVYSGSETQTVDPAIEAYEGVGNSSAYRGTAYLVFEDLDVTQNRVIPLIEVEVVKDGALGDLITYYDENMSATASHSEDCASTHVRSQGEIWTIDAGHNMPFGTKRLAIFNLATAATTFVDFPDDHTTIGTGEVPKIRWFEGCDKVTVAARNSGGQSTLLIYDAGSKQYLGSWNDYMGYTGVQVLWIDDTYNEAFVVHEGIGYEVWSVDPATLLPILELAQYSGGSYAHGTTRSDANGTFWSQGTLAWHKYTRTSWSTVAHDGDGVDTGPTPEDHVIHDASRDCLYYWSSAGTYLKKVDCATNVITRVNAAAYSPAIGKIAMFMEPNTDLIYALDGGTAGVFALYTISPTDGAYTTYAIPDTGGAHFAGSFAFAQGIIWSHSADYSASESGLGELRFDALTETSPTLADVVTEISAEVSLEAAKLNVTALVPITVRGYSVGRVGTGRAAVEPLLDRFAFDLIESDGKIKAVLRGGAVAYVFSEDELGAVEFGSKSAPKLSVVRKQDPELPRRFRVKYPDIDARYAIGVQEEPMLGGDFITIVERVSSVVMTADEAKQMAMRLLYTEHAARFQIQWKGTIKHAWLEPTDRVQLPRGSTLYTARIMDKGEAGNGVTFAGETDDAAVYTQTGTGGEVAAAVSSIQGIGATQLVLLDIPLLRPEDDGVGMYATGAGVLDTWRGANVFRSTDATNYSALNLTLRTSAAVGVALDALAASVCGNVIDHASTVTVSLVQGSAPLSNAVSLAALYGGVNHAVVGDEIIGYLYATLVAADTYRLSGLLRERAGTSSAGHAIGDRFALLTPSAVVDITLSMGDLNGEAYYKAVTFTRTLTQTGAVTHTFTNERQVCLSPVHLRGTRDASTNDVVISCTRRSRYAGDDAWWADYADTPLGEASELYDFEIWNSTFTTRYRLFEDQTVSSVTYTSAQQTTDFGSPQSIVYVRVYQKNGMGRGHVLQGSVR